FSDEAGADGFSDTGRTFIGGLLRYAKVIDALIAPTVNCLRRRRRHTFSPTNVSWGLEDRSALIRLKGGSPTARHLEYRAPSALSNPYLVCAALLSAGLQGIEDRVDPGPSSATGLRAEADPDFEML